MNKLFENIFNVSLAVLMVVTAIIALFGAGELLQTLLRDVIFNVPYERCIYPPELVKGVVEQTTCVPDYAQTKRNIADGLSMLLVSAPVAILAYRKLLS